MGAAPHTYPELEGVEVEHLLGAATGLPLVKLRVIATERGRPVIVVGEVTVENARDIAGHLLEAAARAEYERDTVAGLEARFDGKVGADPVVTELVRTFLGAARSGEVSRHTDTPPAG